MYWTAHLSQQERDSILSYLNEKQKEFVMDHLKRGRRTIFANVLAKEKAGVVHEGDNVQIAEQWELIDYIDAGPGWQKDPKYFCECGRALRYQYIVQNKELNQLKKFGITHFEEHTGISPRLAKEIVKGIERIDYEMDEILIKISKGWTPEEEGINEIPSSNTIPTDIQHHFDCDVPLLDRQVSRLKQKVTVHWQEINRQHIEMKMLKEKQAEKQRVEKHKKLKQELANNIARGMKMNKNTNLDLSEKLQVGVMTYLYSLVESEFSANEICKDLVAYHGASAEIFSSGTLKIYPNVCSFLEHLKDQEILEFVKKVGMVDRIYRVLELPQYDEEELVDNSQMDLFDNL